MQGGAQRCHGHCLAGARTGTGTGTGDMGRVWAGKEIGTETGTATGTEAGTRTGTGQGQGRAGPGQGPGRGQGGEGAGSPLPLLRPGGGPSPARGWNRGGARRPHPEPGRCHRASFVRSPGNGWDKAGGVPRVSGSRALTRGHGKISVTLLGRCHRQPGPALLGSTSRSGCVASRLAREQPDRCGDFQQQ